jgi:aldehyde dehydrogenase (NAD+)
MSGLSDAGRMYIDGAWVASSAERSVPLISPASGTRIGSVALGDARDLDAAVAAARRAFASFAATTREDRLALFARINEIFKRRLPELGAAISREMGAPITFATRMQAGAGMAHFRAAAEVLKTYPFEETLGAARLLREPIGVAGMITPWNWPANQIACKVAPALAAGCTMVLKPSELAPLSAVIIAEILHEAGVPKGVFNMVQGDGPAVGAPMAAHAGIDMISFTGSTRAGIDVAVRAAPTVKRVSQELGGKSANILLDDADFAKMVPLGVQACMRNSGQSCNAPTRMLVPAARMGEVAELARGAVERMKVGDPAAADTDLGPVVSAAQWGKIQALIETGIRDGARVVTGGAGRPVGFERGHYVKPTVFSDVMPDMTIAREEIFGPVLSIIGYRDEADAIQIANDTPYGLAAYVCSSSSERAARVARQMRAGNVHINMAPGDIQAPFGGYKQSGNGREWGRFGLEEYLEVKAVTGG